MGEATVMLWLQVAAIVLGVLLLLASAAAFGRILADLEYQLAAGLNGVRRIQSHINLRTHGNRIGLALFTLVAGVLGLLDAGPAWREWVARALFLAVLAGYTVSSILDWLAERAQVRLLLRERDEGLHGPAPLEGGHAP
jgi:hypothetical protein